MPVTCTPDAANVRTYAGQGSLARWSKATTAGRQAGGAAGATAPGQSISCLQHQFKSNPRRFTFGDVVDGDSERKVSGGLTAHFGDARPALLRFLIARGAAPDEAEDILQDVHMKLLTEPSGPVAQPRAYLYAMTNNHFLAHRRAASRRARREEVWASLRQTDGSEADEKPSAEAQIIAREQVAMVQRALDALPERTRLVFRRFRIEGEPQRVIAADLGISVSAVEKHLTRAYQALATVKLRLDAPASDAQQSREGARHAR